MLSIIIALFIWVDVIQTAQKKNRNVAGWAIFALFVPIIPWIWIHCLNTKIEWNDAEESATQENQKND